MTATVIKHTLQVTVAMEVVLSGGRVLDRRRLDWIENALQEYANGDLKETLRVLQFSDEVMRSTPIADDPGSWVWPDDLKEKVKQEHVFTHCPHCHVPWMHHDQSTCSGRTEECGLRDSAEESISRSIARCNAMRPFIKSCLD